MFYDGDCPLCLRETNFIRRLNRNRRVCFTNIASPDFHPSSIG
ncbi:MAG: DCC1-like thiol-disulfide oxidoreductase family protein [Planctomycetales bacterium]